MPDFNPDDPITDIGSVWTSPSFWVAVLPVIGSLLSLFFGKQFEFDGDDKALALLAASIAATGLAIARSMRHRVVAQAKLELLALRYDSTQRKNFATVDEVGTLQKTVHDAVQEIRERLRSVEAPQAPRPKRTPSRVSPKK